MTHTIADLVDYVMKNRKGKAFVGWSADEIAGSLVVSAEEVALVYSVDEGGRVNGIAHGVKFSDEKVMFVANMLATAPGILKRFVEWFHKLYPEYKLEATRRGRRVCYDTPRLTTMVLARKG